MRRTAILLCAAALAAGCSRALVWQRYADASGDFSSEAPVSWRAAGDPDLKRRPVAVLTFLGEVQAQDEGVPLGALINVTRVTRTPSELPAGDRARKVYDESWLAPSDVLFGGPVSALPAEARKNLPRVSDASLGGKPARTYEREFAYFNAVHMPLPLQMRLVDVVVRTDKAYYIVEYRATRELFEKHRPVFERFLKAFSFGPSA